MLMVLGLLVGWWREGTAAILLALGWAVVRVSEPVFQSATRFELILLLAGLYALCWWADRGRQTRRVVCGSVVLIGGVIMGRLFSPFNVFITGAVLDAADSHPIANARITLVQRPSAFGAPTAGSDACTDLAGRFQLYVSRYAPGRHVVVTAPGCVNLTTNLAPRALGQRRISRNFQLLRSTVATTEALGPLLPVVVEHPGLVVTSLPDDLWQASVTFRNRGGVASPAFSVLFYAGSPHANGRPISKNTAGPVDPGLASSVRSRITLCATRKHCAIFTTARSRAFPPKC